MELKKFFIFLVFLIVLFVILIFLEESVEDDVVVEVVVEGMEIVGEVEKDDVSDDEVKEEDDVLVLIIKIFDFVVNDKDIMLVEFYVLWFVDIYVLYVDINFVF